MPTTDLSKQIADLTDIVQEFVETMRDQSKELRRLTVWLEQQTDLRDEPKDLSVETSRLSALLHRVGSFREELQRGHREE